MSCGGRFEPHQLSFLELSREPPSYLPVLVNWTNSLVFHPAQLPNHPDRQSLAEAAFANESNLMEPQKTTEKSLEGPKKERKLTGGRSPAVL